MTLKAKLRYMLLTFIAAMVLGIGGAHAGGFESDADEPVDQTTQDEAVEWEEEDDDDLDDEWGQPDDDEDDGW